MENNNSFNYKSAIFLVVLVLIVLAAGAYILAQNEDELNTDLGPNDNPMMDESENMDEEMDEDMNDDMEGATTTVETEVEMDSSANVDENGVEMAP